MIDSAIRTQADLSARGAVQYVGAPSLASLIGQILGGIGPGDAPVLVLYANETDTPTTLAGMRLWPIGDLAAGGADAMAINLITWPTLDVSTMAGAVLIAQLTTVSVSWVMGQPLSFTKTAPLVVPVGGVLAVNAGPIGMGQALPTFVLRAH